MNGDTDEDLDGVPIDEENQEGEDIDGSPIDDMEIVEDEHEEESTQSTEAPLFQPPKQETTEQLEIVQDEQGLPKQCIEEDSEISPIRSSSERELAEQELIAGSSHSTSSEATIAYTFDDRQSTSLDEKPDDELPVEPMQDDHQEANNDGEDSFLDVGAPEELHHAHQACVDQVDRSDDIRDEKEGNSQAVVTAVEESPNINPDRDRLETVEAVPSEAREGKHGNSVSDAKEESPDDNEDISVAEIASDDEDRPSPEFGFHPEFAHNVDQGGGPEEAPGEEEANGEEDAGDDRPPADIKDEDSVHSETMDGMETQQSDAGGSAEGDDVATVVNAEIIFAHCHICGFDRPTAIRKAAKAIKAPHKGKQQYRNMCQRRKCRRFFGPTYILAKNGTYEKIAEEKESTTNCKRLYANGPRTEPFEESEYDFTQQRRGGRQKSLPSFAGFVEEAGGVAIYAVPSTSSGSSTKGIKRSNLLYPGSEQPSPAAKKMRKGYQWMVEEEKRSPETLELLLAASSSKPETASTESQTDLTELGENGVLEEMYNRTLFQGLLPSDEVPLAGSISQRLKLAQRIIEQQKKQTEELRRQRDSLVQCMAKANGEIKKYRDVMAGELRRLKDDIGGSKKELKVFSDDLKDEATKDIKLIDGIKEAVEHRVEETDRFRRKAQISVEYNEALRKSAEDRATIVHREISILEKKVIVARDAQEDAETKLNDKIYLANNARCAHCQVNENIKKMLTEQITDKTLSAERLGKARAELERKFANSDKVNAILSKENAKLKYELKAWESTCHRLTADVNGYRSAEKSRRKKNDEEEARGDVTPLHQNGFCSPMPQRTTPSQGGQQLNLSALGEAASTPASMKGDESREVDESTPPTTKAKEEEKAEAKEREEPEEGELNTPSPDSLAVLPPPPVPPPEKEPSPEADALFANWIPKAAKPQGPPPEYLEAMARVEKSLKEGPPPKKKEEKKNGYHHQYQKQNHAKVSPGASGRGAAPPRPSKDDKSLPPPPPPREGKKAAAPPPPPPPPKKAQSSPAKYHPLPSLSNKNTPLHAEVDLDEVYKTIVNAASEFERRLQSYHEPWIPDNTWRTDDLTFKPDNMTWRTDAPGPSSSPYITVAPPYEMVSPGSGGYFNQPPTKKAPPPTAPSFLPKAGMIQPAEGRVQHQPQWDDGGQRGHPQAMPRREWDYPPQRQAPPSTIEYDDDLPWARMTVPRDAPSWDYGGRPRTPIPEWYEEERLPPQQHYGQPPAPRRPLPDYYNTEPRGYVQQAPAPIDYRDPAPQMMTPRRDYYAPPEAQPQARAPGYTASDWRRDLARRDVPQWQERDEWATAPQDRRTFWD